MASLAAALKVRVEDDTSIGRSYSSGATKKAVAGLGARRRALRTRSFRPFDKQAVGEDAGAVACPASAASAAASTASQSGGGGAPASGPLPFPPSLEGASMAVVNLRTLSREGLLAYLRNTWAKTDALFSALRDDSVFYAVPDKLRRPLIFYFGHPAALYINKMHQAGLVDNINPYFQKLFETGVDEMSWDDMDEMQDEDFAWPDVHEVMAFRKASLAAVEGIIARMPAHALPAENGGSPITQASPYWALVMAFEHEHIHLETSSVLMRQLPVDSVVAPPGWRTAPSFATTAASSPSPSADAEAAALAPANALVQTEAATVVLGKPHDFPSFGWDNEYGKRVVEVPSFEASRYTVSNAEFLPFVSEGGYETRAWWVSPAGDDEGWRWRCYRNATHPSFWVAPAHPAFVPRFVGGKPGLPYQKDDGNAARAGTDASWKLRTEFDIVPMAWDWPCEVNYLEATAFLRWKASREGGGVSYRLPTEAEYHVVRGDPSPWPEATVGRAAPDAGTSAGEGKASASDSAGNGKVLPAPEAAEDGSPAAAAAALAAAARYDPVMAPAGAPGNLNFRFHSPTPVDFYAPSPTGFYDAHGNVWQWVEDHFAPLPGFEFHYLYDDFSTPCFDGWHTMIVGGSWASAGNLASSFARYHFRRHFFQQLGFRYVRLPAAAAPEPWAGAATVANLWEVGTAVSKDITDAFGSPEDRLSFPWPLAGPESALQYGVNLAHLAAKAYEAHIVRHGASGSASSASSLSAASAAAASAPTDFSGVSVLHIGCGVGGATFELARAFGSVVGVDKSEASVRHARILQHHGQFEYERVREGVLTDTALVRVPAGVDRSRVAFVMGDAEDGASVMADLAAAALSPAANGGGFDVVILDGVVARVRQPLHVLAAASELTRPGGLLLVTSNNDWDASVTPRNSWLGGFKMNGEDQTTSTMLRYALKKTFSPVESLDLAKLSRSHARRFTLDIVQATVWRRHSGGAAPYNAQSMPPAEAAAGAVGGGAA